MGVPVEVVELLGGVPLFARLPPEALHDLAAVTGRVDLAAGEVLLEAGEVGDRLYVVASGRLEVLLDGAPVRRQGRGDVIGELALLGADPSTASVRTATVRAVRDSTLVTLGRDRFAEVLAREPSVARGLVDVLAARLPRAVTPQPVHGGGGVVALVASGATADRVGVLADRLGVELGRLVRSVTLTEPGPGSERDWGPLLDRAEADNAVVLLVAPTGASSWGEFCRRQADRVLLVAGSSSPGVPGTAELPERLDADRATPAAVARLARRLAGRAVGVVLSGGGARGLAHLGVVQVLEECGVVVDRWGGTSMGALVAAAYARGTSGAEIAETLRRELVQGRPFGDVVLPRHSLIRGRRAERMLHRVLGEGTVEDLPARFFAVSCDLLTAAEVVHRSGSLVQAVGASMRIPGVAPPAVVGGRVLVDGGVLNNLPVDVMAADREGPVVGVDVMRPFGPPGAGAVPGIVETIGRSMVLGSWQKSARHRELARLVISPELGTVGLFDFGRYDELVRRGRQAAAAEADALAALVRA